MHGNAVCFTLYLSYSRACLLRASFLGRLLRARGTGLSTTSAFASTGAMSRNNVFQYTVGATPDKNLVYTNHVYLADDASNAALLTKRSGQTDTYVLVNNSVVYVARPHKGVNPGEIGLSSIQREACQVMQGALTSIAYWEQPRDGRADLVTLSLNLDLVGIKRTTVAAVELAPMLIKYFAGQVFTKGQIFCCEYNGAALKFRVEYGEAGVPVNEQNKKLQHAQETDDASDDEGAVTQQVDRGVLHKGTQIELTAAANKSLTFIPEARKPQMLNPKFKFSEMGIGGLDAEFGMIFRRAFMSRMYPEQSRKLGVPPVKGMLLYGPPGTGKTLIARQIGKLLATKEPKVVNGPEILNKFVGASEENIRNLFKEAEEDQKANGDNAELHIIILDEIDAICKARGRGGDSTGVHDTIVNQFLSKIDGVEALNNILVIGMTNRKELIDPALLRPGRLEVHIEIGLPDEKGRVQIFNIQLAKMKENGMLAPDVVVDDLARETRNFSGAEIGGVAKSAASFALFETHDMKHGTKAVDMSNKRILVARHHFERAISEVTPAFGVDEDEFKLFLRAPLINYGPEYERLMKTCETLVNQVRTDKETPLLSLLLEGPTGAGKTAIAAKLAVESKFPFAKVITPEQFVGYSESKKINDIAKIFEDAYKSPLSVIVLDSIERLIEYTPVGPRFSQGVLQTLLVLVKRLPPHPNRRLLVLGTSSHAALLESLEITQAFNVAKRVPALTNARQVEAVLATKAFPTANGPAGLREIASQCFLPIPVKELLRVQAMARQELTTQGVVTPARFQECLVECGFDSGAAISMHSTIAGKSDLKYYTSGASAAAGKGKKNAGDSDDDDY